jgi:uncharacterized circularly permuted ATP-grasp superfamily protein/uncharacterized alpha-E superfamily protein
VPFAGPFVPHRPSPPLLHPAQLRSLRNRLRLSIRDAGLTDLAAAASHDGDPAPFWQVEPTPLILGADEWNVLERALRQRARLVNAFLADLYGAQTVLKERVLPPEIALADPYYRRPCLGLTPNRTTPATLLRFDLVKSASGWVFTETQSNTPIGLSYAVQNRRFLTQESGDTYRALPDYHSIINGPLQLLDALRALAPRPVRAPSIIVLTTGPRFPFFSEHSFLARKMGLPLAQGDDLLVLDNRVYFKTVAGLEPVDVIYRRLNDAHIDPVVFSTDRATAGIPGLMQCIRAGNVVVANGIGTGVAESRSLLAYLPQLTRYYLSERPLLPSIPTFTCGDIDQLDYILDHRDELRLRPIHEPRLGQSAAAELTWEGGRLPAPIVANPHGYVAQRPPVSVSLVPGAKQALPFRLATFVLTEGRQMSVLPGGITLLGNEDPTPDRLGITADVIVLAGSQTIPGGPADQEVPVTRGAQSTLPGSRAAENLFWLGRYLERAESTARMLSILDDVVLEEIPARDRRRWLPVWRGLLEATGHHGERITARANPQAVLSPELMTRMTLDPSNSGSLLASIRSAGHNARQLREFLSPEAGGILTGLQQTLEPLAAQRKRGRADARGALAPAAIRAVLTHVNACLGVTARTMLHDAAWHFLQLGLQLERAIMTCSALRHVLGALDTAARTPATASLGGQFQDNPELSALLRMLGSQDAYRRLYQTRSQPRLVAELFLQQRAVPRSILHHLDQMQGSLKAICALTCDRAPPPAAKALDATREFLQALPLEHHFHPRAAADAGLPTLAEQLGDLLNRLYDVHPLLSDHYFSHQARLAPAAVAELSETSAAASV